MSQTALGRRPISPDIDRTRPTLPARRGARDRMRALLRATRPRQWTKNLLVFAAPTAAGSIVQAGVAARSAMAFVVFVAASASTYLVNDVVDRDNDLLHPVKRNRPVRQFSRK